MVDNNLYSYCPLLTRHVQGLAVIGPLLVQPIKLRSAPWKVMKSRIELLDALNHDPGLEVGGLTSKKVMEVVEFQ